MSERVLSKDLVPGTVMRHRDGHRATLERRKTDGEVLRTGPAYWPGWWVTGGGGLADRVIDAENSNWTVDD